MISIAICFYFLVFFFGTIGAIRGWQKEVISLAGLVGSIAFLHQFGVYLVDLGSNIFEFGSGVSTAEAGRELLLQRSFWIQAIFHSLLAFFSYQIISNLADRAPNRNGSDRIRNSFQNGFIGWVLGLINGYLLVGGLWGFLEYRVVPGGYERLPVVDNYFFDPNIVTRIPPDAIETAIDIANYLPVNLFGSGIWLLLFFISFFIVIIALI